MYNYSVSFDVLQLEGRVSKLEIDIYKQKLDNKFNKIDERFILLTEAKYKLTSEQLMMFEKMSNTYLSIKAKYQDIFVKQYLYPQIYKDNFELK